MGGSEKLFTNETHHGGSIDEEMVRVDSPWSDPATMTHPSLKCAQSNDLEKNKPSKEGHTGKPPQGRHRASSKTIISFRHGDPEDPVNWSKWRKFHVIMAGIMSVINSTLGSSLPSGAITYIAKDFHVTSDEQLVLPISIFLVGYVVGPLLCGPLSESYGRKIVMLSTFVTYTLFTLACAVAPNWPSLLVFRLIVGMSASAPIAVVGGLYADINSDPRKRGRSMAYFMAATTFGPMLGPLISGFISLVNWRWTFWFGLIFAGVTLPLVAFMPETYAPILLKRKASAIRKETDNPHVLAAIELEKKGAKEMITRTLTRPIRMFIYEAIVFFTCMYCALAYGIFYLYFQAYPIIFQGIYGMSIGISGLAFLPIGVGATFACAIFLWYDSFLHKAKMRNAAWAEVEEHRRLPLACVGGPLYVIALFWVGWTASRHIHWIVPMLSGIFFGTGFLLIFMAMLNYLTDAYETFAASAQGAASCARSICGALLPLAAKPMYTHLGVNWASSLLAFLSLGMTVIPFAFIRYGDRIRASSKFCQYLQEMKKKAEEEEEQEHQRVEATMLTDVEKGHEKETA